MWVWIGFWGKYEIGKGVLKCVCYCGKVKVIMWLFSLGGRGCVYIVYYCLFIVFFCF